MAIVTPLGALSHVSQKKRSCVLNKAQDRSKEKSNHCLSPGKEFRVVRISLIFLIVLQQSVGGPWNYVT